MENKGDVAFVKHTTVRNVQEQELDWASGMSDSDYRLLCKDGTTRPVDQFEDCNLAKVCLCTNVLLQAFVVATAESFTTTVGGGQK